MKSSLKRILIFLGISLFALLIFLYGLMWILVNGPSRRAKELFVMSVRETSALKFLANVYCSDEEIAKIEAKKSKSADAITNTSLIHSKVLSRLKDDEENAVTNETDVDKDRIDVEQITGSTYKGFVMTIYDSSRVFVGVSTPEYDEKIPGKKVVEMISSYGAVAGVNASGFEDPNGLGDGSLPIGLVISEGNLKFGDLNKKYDVIGFNEDNVLVLGTLKGEEITKLNLRDAVSFSPLLIVNGERTEASYSGGLNPRTAIGQREDGAVILIVIDGRQSSSLGASYSDITELMLKYGAINAANLDGGSSSVMYYNGKLLNNCCSVYGPRQMPTSILVR